MNAMVKKENARTTMQCVCSKKAIDTVNTEMDLRSIQMLAIILSPNTPRFERPFWRPKIGSLEGHFGFFGPNNWKSGKNHGKYCMNRDLRVTAIILTPNPTRFERFFWRPKMGSFYGHFGFFAQNAGHHVQNIANIVWIVIYECSRSFWAQTRLDLTHFFKGPKLAPWRVILGF